MVREIITSIEIAAPPQEVWKVLADTQSYSEWNPFILSLEGTIQKDEKLEVLLKNGEGTMKFKPKVQEVTPGKSFSWLGKLFLPKLFDGHHKFELEALDDGTTKFVHSEKFSGLLVWLILKFIGDQTRNNFEAMNHALKERLESN